MSAVTNRTTTAATGPVLPSLPTFYNNEILITFHATLACVVGSDRRSLLALVGGLVAGGYVRGEFESRDSDGDSVVDGEDYAPRDPNVRKKSDLTTEAPKGGATPPSTPMDSVTPAPEATATSNPALEWDRLVVSDEYWNGTTRATSYGLDLVSVQVHDDVSPEFEECQVVVHLQEFPWGTTLGFGSAGAFSKEDLPVELEVPVETDGRVPAETRVHYTVHVVPAGTEPSGFSSGEYSKVFETDPFVRRRGTGAVERRDHKDGLEPAEAEGYTRRKVEGAYVIRLEGRTRGTDWASEIYLYKSTYIDALNRSRGRSTPEYVNYELTSGFAPALASTLDDVARDIGFTSKQARLAFVIDYVQRLPYVSDDVSKGFDQYTKFVAETLAEGNGDCEDTAVMLASVLEADLFGYDMVLIEPPGHMAAGVGGGNLRGAYYEYGGRDYYFIETTGEGWGIGEVPSEYEGAKASIYQV